MSRIVSCLALAAAGAAAGTAFAALEAKDVIAAQIRRQGYKCDSPKEAKRDADNSKPDAAGWILECGNATYRVQLIPHMAAKVEFVPPLAPPQSPSPQNRP